jgi:hypothetical protein
MATKSHVWRAENEWRLMLRNTETDQNIVKRFIGSEAVSRIFLGLQFPDEEKNKIVAVARENFPASRIFHARKKHGDFAVEFHQY